MFAVGHFALGYIIGKFTAQTTKTKLNLPLVFTLSVIPDIDLLLPFLEHRGPSHSIVVAIVAFIPALTFLHYRALPYLAVLIQHSLLGDFIAGGKTQLFWPLSSKPYGIELSIYSLTNIALEWMIFLASVTIMLSSGDMRILFKPHNYNLLLLIPTFTVLLPTFLAYPLKVPLALIPPHIMFIALFAASLLVDIKHARTL